MVGSNWWYCANYYYLMSHARYNVIYRVTAEIFRRVDSPEVDFDDAAKISNLRNNSYMKDMEQEFLFKLGELQQHVSVKTLCHNNYQQYLMYFGRPHKCRPTKCPRLKRKLKPTNLFVKGWLRTRALIGQKYSTMLYAWPRRLLALLGNWP